MPRRPLNSRPAVPTPVVPAPLQFNAPAPEQPPSFDTMADNLATVFNPAMSPYQAMAAVDLSPGAMPDPGYMQWLASQYPTQPAAALAEMADSGEFAGPPDMPTATEPHPIVAEVAEAITAMMPTLAHLPPDVASKLADVMCGVVRAIDEHTSALRVVGAQQQWTTDMVGQAKEQFDGMMSGGGPMAMIGKMLGGGRKK